MVIDKDIFRPSCKFTRNLSINLCLNNGKNDLKLTELGKSHTSANPVLSKRHFSLEIHSTFCPSLFIVSSIDEYAPRSIQLLVDFCNKVDQFLFIYNTGYYMCLSLGRSLSTSRATC